MAAKLSPEEKEKQAAERNAAREAARAAKAAEKKAVKFVQDQPQAKDPVASESSSPQNDLEKHPKFDKFKRGGSPQ